MREVRYLLDYIALAARTVDMKAKITARENSIFAIHNPYTYTHGDYRDLKKMSDYLEKITAVYASAHITVSGKTEQEIRAAMDNETFYVGQEIEAAGFANDYEVASNPESESEESPAARRDNIIITAKFAMNKAIEKTQKAEANNPSAYNSDLEKVVALIIPNTPVASSTKPGEKINVNLGGLMKTPEELLAQNKELYDAVFALGEKAGIEKERARVNAHLLLGEKSESLALAAKHIKAGVSTSDETVQAEYFAAKLDKGRIEARNVDNIGDIQTGGEAGTGGSPEDDQRLKAAFEKGFTGKDLGCKSWTE